MGAASTALPPQHEESPVADLVRVTQQWAKLAPTRERAEALDRQLHRHRSVSSAVRSGVPVLAAERWGNASGHAAIAAACGRAVIIARVEVTTGAVSLVSRTTLQGTNARERRHAATPDADDVGLAHVNNNHCTVMMPSPHQPMGTKIQQMRSHRIRSRARVGRHSGTRATSMTPPSGITRSRWVRALD